MMAFLETTKYTIASVLLLTSTIARAAVPAAELNALTDLYNDTNGINWTDNSDWLGGDPCVNNWFGVTCDAGDTTVTALDLADNNLDGTIPTSLGALGNLGQLNLGSNQISGNIPSDIGDLFSLIHLDLSFNQLNGNIPPELGDLASVQDFDLSFNQLTGSIPNSLSNLSSVEFINLSWNALTGTIPAWIGSLSNLRTLYLATNQLSGGIPAALGNLSNLEYLSLFANPLGGTIPAELGDLSNLKELGLSNNELEGGIPPQLGNLASLTGLDLMENQLTGEIPKELANFTDPTFIYLAKNRLSGTIPTEIGDMGNLEWFQVQGNGLEGPIPDSMINMTGLHDAGGLNIAHNKLSTGNAALDAFLDTKQAGGDWSATQTITPKNVSVESSGGESATVNFVPIEYMGDTGRYRALYSRSPGGPYMSGGTSEDKTANSVFVDGLSPAITYYFVVQTETDSHIQNPSDLISETGDEVNTTPMYVDESTGFDTDFDFLTEPEPAPPFTEAGFNNGFDITQDAVVTVLDSHTTNASGLTINSENATWHDAADDGVFVGLSVFGDFTAEMTVTGMSASADHSVGLMIRVPANGNLDAAGPGQDWVAIGLTGGITNVNTLDTDDGVTSTTTESAPVQLSTPLIQGESNMELRIQRSGSVLRNGSVLQLFYRVEGGSEWISAATSPLVREDIDTLEVEVGIYQTSSTESIALIEAFEVRSERIFMSGYE